ncbi:MAG: 5-(carboxyamino)imidazole ribonucleotide mutase [Peptococcaceae bacterium]
MLRPLVGIVMGSDADLPVMRKAWDMMNDFDIPSEIIIASAHRSPEKAVAYARSAVDRGLSVIIAGAGGAAHLPGVIAACTPLPVIGVPVKNSSLNGLDALFSIVQMPAGVPVATVAINGAKNAAILAAQIIGISEPAVRAKIENYKAKLAGEVEAKAEQLAKLGVEGYSGLETGS